MYKNAGRKIQILAIVIFALGVIATLYWCVELWHAHDEGPFGGSPIPAILAFGILGTAASWAVGLLIHGYGELVDKVAAWRTGYRQRPLSRLSRFSRPTPKNDTLIIPCKLFNACAPFV